MIGLQENDRLIQLFGYETYNGKDSPLWTKPHLFILETGQGARMLDEEFQSWIEKKRVFTKDEVINRYWIKISDSGSAFKVRLKDDNTLDECSLFNEKEIWHGTWKVSGPALKITAGEYNLEIIGNKNDNIHSGIEYNSQNICNYFKVILVNA